MPIVDRLHSSPRHITLIAVVVVIAVLYFAREVFIPLSLAVLFSFLLGPLVLRLRHWGFGRVTSVATAVLLACLLAVIAGGLVTGQLVDLGHKLPEYQKNIHDKLQTVRESSKGALGWITRVTHDFSKELDTSKTAVPAVPEAEKPVPVEIRKSPFSPLELMPTVLGSLLHISVISLLVIVFVIFMLLQREDLRDRFIRLVGTNRMNVTTRALDDAAHRVSRYLLAQLAVNVAFAIPAGIGLYFIGVPNPVLWALLATVLRYIPYVGMWIAALMPAAVALAIDPGWIKPLSVLALYLAIDLLMYNFVEPPLYGNSTGMTPLAILVATVFWTWLWGPVGLFLATPLTVCVAVIGRYAPSLQFLGILLCDEPVLPADRRFYQRLLAMNLEEATDLAEEFLKEKKSLEDFFDGVVSPALSLAEEDRHCGRLDEKQQEFIIHHARMLVEDIAERAEASTGDGVEGAGPVEGGGIARENGTPGVTVLSLPARDEADEIGALMLTLLLNRRGIPVRSASGAALTSERLEEAGQEGIQVACVTAVPPQGYLHARYLCKRLRTRFPRMKIVAVILNQGDANEVRNREPRISADEIATSLKQAVAEIIALVPGSVSPETAPLEVVHS